MTKHKVIQQLSRGFTMIELLVVTTIIIVLTTIGLVSYQKASETTRNAKRKADLETIRQALVLYRTDSGEYPDTSTFATMLTTISDYLGSNSTTFADPKNVSPYTYSYNSDGVSFTLTGALEPDGTAYQLSNP